MKPDLGMADMLVDDRLVAALVMLLEAHGGSWEGSMGELLGALPGAASDPLRLRKRMTTMTDALVAAGIGMARRRQAGTGTRIVTLRSAATKPNPDPVQSENRHETRQGREAMAQNSGPEADPDPNRRVLARVFGPLIGAWGGV